MQEVGAGARAAVGWEASSWGWVVTVVGGLGGATKRSTPPVPCMLLQPQAGPVRAELTLSSIWSESLKSLSMASMSASLGRRVDKKGRRPTFLCTRCMAAEVEVGVRVGEMKCRREGWREWEEGGRRWAEERVTQSGGRKRAEVGGRA